MCLAWTPTLFPCTTTTTGTTAFRAATACGAYETTKLAGVEDGHVSKQASSLLMLIVVDGVHVVPSPIISHPSQTATQPVALFLGIRYANPLTPAHRWQPPPAPSCPEGASEEVIQAVDWGPRCLQYNGTSTIIALRPPPPFCPDDATCASNNRPTNESLACIFGGPQAKGTRTA